MCKCVATLGDTFCLYLQYMNTESNKITEEELSQLNDLHRSIGGLKTEIADLEIKKSRAIGLVGQAGQQLFELQTQLAAKYGNVKINSSTGEYVNQEDINRA